MGEQTSNYLWWNDELASHFFNSAVAGQPVNLFVTRELIEQIGARKRLDMTDFVEAVNLGPKWAPYGKLCEKAYAIFDGWRKRKLQYPPYLGYLSLFVLAAGLEGDFAPNAYYPRLRTLLKQKPEPGPYTGYDEMHKLWADLEQWSNVDRQGDLGIFTIRVAGNRAHVGLPIAQIILSEREREALPKIFADSYLDPGLAYSDAELAIALRQHANCGLSSTTVAILSPHNRETDRFDLLLDTVREELAKWDGSTNERAAVTGKESVHGGLRLSLTINRAAARVDASLHCHLNRDYPEGGLNLRGVGVGRLSCEEYLEGWSTPLMSLNPTQKLDGSQLRWDKGIELHDEKLGWTFHFPPRDFRIFAPGATMGLAGFVEVNQLSNVRDFRVVVAPIHVERIRSWGEKSCKSFEEINVNSGLPHGWRLFSGKEPQNDAGLSQISPALAFSSTVRIALRNGIRIGKGNTFFDFGIPDVAIEGGNRQEQVFCNNKQVLAADTGLYTLPNDLPVGSRITIEVRRGQETLRCESLYLQNETEWQRMNPIRTFDRFGNPTRTGGNISNGFAGAWCDYTPEQVTPYLYPVGKDRGDTYFIGPEPGQIVSWPEEALPPDWSPVWAVFMRQKRGRVAYCGTELKAPSSCKKGANRRKVSQWQDVLWHSRKRISSPTIGRVRDLWHQYVKAARDVR